MAVARSRGEAGFTLIELMITVAIIAILAGIALGQFRDYTRRAKMSEVIMATTTCKSTISEGYLSMGSAPAAGAWGCERVISSTPYVGAVKTSADGAVRVTVSNLDPALNEQFIHLVPVKLDGSTPLTSSADLGNAVPQWLCGSDSHVVRKALPGNCRADTTPFASATFE